MASAADLLGNINAALEPLVRVDTDLALGESLDGCIAQIATAVVGLSQAGFSTEAVQRALLNALSAPFQEFGRSLQDLLVPDPSAIDTGSLESMAHSYAMQVVEAIKNPFLAIIEAQRDIFFQSVDRAGELLFRDDQREQGGLVQLWSTVNSAVMQLFVDEQTAGASIGGILWYGVEEVLPAIDAELRYLKELRRAITTSFEEAMSVSQVGDAVLPQATVAVKLCEVDEDLKIVVDELRGQNRWNRRRFASATESVCDAAEFLSSGIFPEKWRDIARALTGYSDAKLNDLFRNPAFMSVKGRGAMWYMKLLMEQIQNQDKHVRTFDRNIRNFFTTLNKVVSVQIGDVLSLIVEVLRRQIRKLRDTLQAQSSGKTAENLFSSAGSQAGSYAVLSALCFMMQRVQSMQRAIEGILAANDRFVAAVKKFIGLYNDRACTDMQGEVLQADVTTYFGELAKSMNQQGSAPALLRAADRLRATIRRQEAALVCRREAMVFGKTNILEAVITVTTLISVVKNLIALARRFKELSTALREGDLLKLFGVELPAFNTDTLIQAIRCLALSCNNAQVSALALTAIPELERIKRNTDSGSLTLGMLDGEPAASSKLNLSIRIGAVFRLVSSIQRLLNLDLTLLCDTIPAQPLTPAPLEEPQVVAAPELDEAEPRPPFSAR